MADRSIDIVEGAKSAYAFALANAPRVWAPLLAGALAGVLGLICQRYGLGLWLLPVVILGLLAGPWAYGALYRIAFAGERGLTPAPGGLAWGSPETRTLLATLLLLLLILLVTLAALFVGLLVGVVLYATVGGGHDMAQGRLWLTDVAAVVLAAAIAWVGVRLILALPASVASGEVQVFTTWPLTKGHVLRLLGLAVLVGAPTILIQGLILLTGAARGNVHDGLDFALHLVAAVLDVVVQVPLWAGLGAYGYGKLRPPA